jgi:hypothetical protein
MEFEALPINVTTKIMKGTHKDPLLSTLIERILVSSNTRKSGEKKKKKGDERKSKSHRDPPKRNKHLSKS